MHMLVTTDSNPLALAGTFTGAILLAVLFILIARVLRREKLLYATGLTLAAAVYPALAFAGDHYEKLLLELPGLVVFPFIAFLGFRWNVRWLAVGWAGHATWDVLFPSAPWWYVDGCIAFDFFLAGYILGEIRNSFSGVGRSLDVAEHHKPQLSLGAEA